MSEDVDTADPGNYGLALDAYSAAGWLGVLPLPPMAKSPPPDRFTGRDGIWPSKADQMDWRLSCRADCNVALRLPPGVVGLDVDQYDEKKGAQRLAEVAGRHGLSRLPSTWRSSAREAPSGIYLFRVPFGQKLRGEAAPGVELIQHHHRFAVVWPSINPKTNTLYRWTMPSGATSLVVPQVDELPELPDDWLSFLTDATPEALSADLPPAERHDEDTWHPLVIEAYRSAYDALLGAQGGSRHDTATTRAMALCRLEQNGLAGSTTALDGLGGLFRSLVAPDRGDDEAAAEWRRIVEGGRALARTTITAAQQAERAEREAYEALRPATPGPLVRLDHEGSPPFRDSPGVAGPGVASGTTVADPCAMALISWPTFWSRERTDPEFLVEPLLARGRSHAVFAAPKVGKSLLMLEVAAACAVGRPVLSADMERDPIEVVYFDLEMTDDDLHERLSDLGYGPDVDLSHLHYYLLPTLPALDTEAGGATIEAIVSLRRAGLVVFDTTSRVVAGAENDADTFRAFYRHTGSRLKRLGVTYARLDHSGKDPEKGQRGSSAKADDVDVVWQLSATSEGVALKATHRRISWIPEMVTLRRQNDPLRHVPADGGWPAGTVDTARAMADLGLPLDVPVRAAVAALKDAGYGRRTTVVTAAVKWRRKEAERLDGLI